LLSSLRSCKPVPEAKGGSWAPPGVSRRYGRGHENLTASSGGRLAPRHLQHFAASRPLGADTFCVGQLDHQLIRLDLDPSTVGVGFVSALCPQNMLVRISCPIHPAGLHCFAIVQAMDAAERESRSPAVHGGQGRNVRARGRCPGSAGPIAPTSETLFPAMPGTSGSRFSNGAYRRRR
jgi:hypothetical protein